MISLGLLASCQLTNLLLYQLLQQQSNPLLGGAGNGLLQSGSSGLLNNFLIPGGSNPALLTTYVTTSTVTKKMTSTEVITVPLLFGNKPSPTTITRTKTYQVTSEELVTLTSTITPSPTTQIIIATSTETPPLPAVVEDPSKIRLKDYSAPNFNSLETQSEAPVTHSKPKSKKRKNRTNNGREERKRNTFDLNPSTDHYSNLEDLSAPAYAPYDYYSKQGEYYQEPANFQGSYDTRRLKRRGDVDEVIQDREYLLEPSYDTDSSNKFPALNKCPEITVTTTKTITKFVNPPASVATAYQPRAPSRNFDRSPQQAQPQQQEYPKQFQPETPRRSRGRGDSRARRVQSTTTPETIIPDSNAGISGTGRDRERFILRNGRSRNRTPFS